VLVLPDGTINFPLVGQLTVEGQTPLFAEQRIARELSEYIPGAVVTLSVVKTSGNRIYVLGEVNKPGEYQPSRPLTVMQALSLAGGLTEFAGTDNILILRRDGDRQVAIPFRYSEVEKGRELATNIELLSGDVVVVPPRSLF
jgi:polysaccharide export outer membrane protein